MKPEKNEKTLSVRVTPSLEKLLDKFCKKNILTKGEAVRFLLEKGLDSMSK
jgi:predicted DNA-binding protein